MFVDATLAARIERAETRGLAAIAARVPGATATALGGGAAIRIRPRSPMNKIVGAGFDGPLDLAAAPDLPLELSTLADPSVAPRRYGLTGFRHVLVRACAAPLDVPPAPGVTIEAVTDLDAWIATSIAGFGSAGGLDPDVLAATIRDGAVVDATRYLARVDGAPAAVAAMSLDADGFAMCFGATTLPAARGRGVHAALTAARLADARAAGAALAVVTTGAGSASQRNLERLGFRIAYARAVLAPAA